MNSSSFRISVIVRLGFIVVTTLLMVWLFRNHNYISAYISIALLLFQMILMIKYVEQTNRKLTMFFDNIKFNDFTSSFVSNNQGESFYQLNQSFNQVIEQFNKTRAEKENHHHQLQTIVEHISIGIVTYRKDGIIDIYNNAFKQIFKINHLKHINGLANADSILPGIFLELQQDDNRLIKIQMEDELLQLSIMATEYKKNGEEYLLVSVKNIHSELERKEMDSWQKLIRVLTHEIMNSITPISSLASTVNDMLQHEDLKQLNADDKEDMLQALSTISRRSKGLLNFVEVYRDLTRIPKPQFSHVVVRELLYETKLMLLHKTDLENLQIEINTLPENVTITADPSLIEQVIINLLINAVQAFQQQKEPKIILSSRYNKNERVIIEIADNGSGIPTDLLDKIFMPFFTSKDSGSGVGLSLSRQIMHLHKGKIYVKSIPGKGSVFTLVF